MDFISQFSDLSVEDIKILIDFDTKNSNKLQKLFWKEMSV
jgi:hypothetical protein